MIKLTYENNGDMVEATFDTIEELEKFQTSRMEKAKARAEEEYLIAKKEEEERIAIEEAKRKEYEEKRASVKKHLRDVFLEAHSCGIDAEEFARMITLELRNLSYSYLEDGE